MSHRQTRFAPTPVSMRGFSLLEIMIALALGLLLTAGIITLFANTSETNKLQDGLARLQENGRFAVTRMENDMRMMAGQYCSNTSGKAAPVSVVPMLPVRAPQVYAPNIGAPFADWHDSGGIKSINAVTGVPTTAAAAIPYALSPRWFVQGYSCTATGVCAPAVPAAGVNDIPAEGLLALRRLPLSDVLTVRYQRGTGWPLQTNQCVHAGAPAKPDDPLFAGDTFKLSPQTGDSPFTIAAPGLALVTDCANSNIIPIGAVTGTTLTVGGGILAGALGNICVGSAQRDVRVFDFSKDFVTVSYYVGLRTDANPDARPNAGAARLIPTLIRRENGVEQELVQGVDQLKFLYGVQDSGGNTRFMTADQVSAGVAFCPPVPDGVPKEPGCLWRAVRTVEAHMLINTVDEVFNLDPTNLQYTFMNASTQTTPTGPMPSGLLAGSMMRREFVSYLSNRNYNF